MAEDQGFEPWGPAGSPVFKTGAISRSANLPCFCFGGDGRIRTYSPEGTDLQSAATLQLSRIPI